MRKNLSCHHGKAIFLVFFIFPFKLNRTSTEKLLKWIENFLKVFTCFSDLIESSILYFVSVFCEWNSIKRQTAISNVVEIKSIFVVSVNFHFFSYWISEEKSDYWKNWKFPWRIRSCYLQFHLKEGKFKWKFFEAFRFPFENIENCRKLANILQDSEDKNFKKSFLCVYFNIK